MNTFGIRDLDMNEFNYDKYLDQKKIWDKAIQYQENCNKECEPNLCYTIPSVCKHKVMIDEKNEKPKKSIFRKIRKKILSYLR
tara:strand:- start:1055 stop:1303 length:249 start_codon:yes stop_codon:yes gene_type:complete